VGVPSIQVRLAACEVLFENTHLLSEVADGGKCGCNQLIVADGHQEQRRRLEIETMTVEARLAIYLDLKRQPQTYANIPEDALAVAKALSVDLFILWQLPSGRLTVQWYNPETMTEFIILPMAGRYKQILQSAVDFDYGTNLINTVDDMGLEAALVPVEELGTRWKSAIETDAMFPTIFFKQDRTVLLHWNGYT
jgi:hypothetical protein